MGWLPSSSVALRQGKREDEKEEGCEHHRISSTKEEGEKWRCCVGVCCGGRGAKRKKSVAEARKQIFLWDGI